MKWQNAYFIELLDHLCKWPWNGIKRCVCVCARIMLVSFWMDVFTCARVEVLIVDNETGSEAGVVRPVAVRVRVCWFTAAADGTRVHFLSRTWSETRGTCLASCLTQNINIKMSRKWNLFKGYSSHLFTSDTVWMKPDPSLNLLHTNMINATHSHLKNPAHPHSWFHLLRECGVQTVWVWHFSRVSI